jgi:hypothetical protein
VQFSANATTTAIINRKATDGAILQFRKDGTTVGSIGTFAGDFVIGSSSGSDAAFRMDGTNNAIYASNTSGNARDAAIDLGASTVRWKDLYLSGGVYLGGTGSANKLDDYEEGTWTPSLSGFAGTPTITNGYYTKIGRHVTASVRIELDNTTDGSHFVITGLPFTSHSSTNNVYGGFVSYSDSSFANNIYPLVDAASSTAKIYKSSGNSFTYSDLGALGELRLVFVYFTP